MGRIAVAAIVPLTMISFAGCSSGRTGLEKRLLIDERLGQVRLSAVVQKTDAPRMTDWGRASAAVLGSREGTNARYFVFLADASAAEIAEALRRLGAQSRVVYPRSEVARHRGIRPDNTPDDYMQGDPVQIFVEWQDGGRRRRMAYEDFFLEKTAASGTETVKPWTPHFIFHGSGVLNQSRGGCIACTNDCPGGIIGNNQYPLAEPIPVIKADWSKLPAPGTTVAVIIRPVASACP